MMDSIETSDSRIVPMRLQKFLARAGVASRRGSEDLMTAGRVTVNGEVVTELGSKVDPRIDVVQVDGAEVTLSDGCVYMMLHKPVGYITTMSDPQGRPTVAELVPCDLYPGLFPVGRLDGDTTGLLLFMTDGELAQNLLHPRRKVSKTYRALVNGRLLESEADLIRNGIILDDGPCAPAVITIDKADTGGSYISCTITEGRKRQVKRMFSAVGHPVLELHRDRFGPIGLGDLPCGQWRLLTPEEVAALIEATSEKEGS